MTEPAGSVGAVAALLREAAEVYRDDPAALAELHAYEVRLAEPLRLAVAGMVKAGKSTLLNALIGEEIAPTGTAECTRVVTWYRYRPTPRVTLHARDGTTRSLPVHRQDGALRLDLGGTPAEEVDRLVVDWPTRGLRDVTLIDTPGIASLSRDVSARATRFLTPQDAASEADAVLYLMRHLHGSDVDFLEAFQDTAAGRSGTVNTLAVLSRADEIGAGRIDALLSAAAVAERYRTDETLRPLALGVVAVAGLMAQSARTLRQWEYAALVRLAGLERAERERLMLSADRFTRPEARVELDAAQRQELLERFGLFGIRMGVALLRGGIDGPTALAHEMVRRSGLEELRALVAAQLQARADHLKARTAVVGVETLLRERPRPGTERLAASLERIGASAHEVRELRLLATARSTGLGVPDRLTEEAERLLGGRGTAPAQRLGLPAQATEAELRASALEHLRRWRLLAESPLSTRPVAEECRVVVRSCEAVLAALRTGSAPDALPGPRGPEPRVRTG